MSPNVSAFIDKMQSRADNANNKGADVTWEITSDSLLVTNWEELDLPETQIVYGDDVEGSHIPEKVFEIVSFLDNEGVDVGDVELNKEESEERDNMTIYDVETRV